MTFAELPLPMNCTGVAKVCLDSGVAAVQIDLNALLHLPDMLAKLSELRELFDPVWSQAECDEPVLASPMQAECTESKMPVHVSEVSFRICNDGALPSSVVGVRLTIPVSPILCALVRKQRYGAELKLSENSTALGVTPESQDCAEALKLVDHSSAKVGLVPFQNGGRMCHLRSCWSYAEAVEEDIALNQLLHSYRGVRKRITKDPTEGVEECTKDLKLWRIADVVGDCSHANPKGAGA